MERRRHPEFYSLKLLRGLFFRRHWKHGNDRFFDEHGISGCNLPSNDETDDFWGSELYRQSQRLLLPDDYQRWRHPADTKQYLVQFPLLEQRGRLQFSAKPVRASPNHLLRSELPWAELQWKLLQRYGQLPEAPAGHLHVLSIRI